jgi:hypothetical protein
MNYKKVILLVAVVGALALAGCGEATNENQGENLGDSSGTNVTNVETGESYYYEVKVTEKNQMGLVQAQPPFVMESSLERANLIQRYKYLNDENNVHHVYLMDEGQVVSYFVAQGKVSSVNSKLTNDKQIVKVEGARFDRGNGAGGANGANYKVVESPQMDGSYGTNGEAIFFFTTDGQYVESSLDYVVSEEPKNIQDEVILVDDPNDGS